MSEQFRRPEGTEIRIDGSASNEARPGQGAATVLALSTPQIMTRAAFAAALPKSEITNTGFYRFMLGEFEITVILDGMRTFDGPHPTFGANRDAGEVQSLMEANFLPSARMIGQFNPVLVNTGKTSSSSAPATGRRAGSLEPGNW
ncbi:hypothetical protein NKZ04_21985 [Sinorhizobium meliloti]